MKKIDSFLFLLIALVSLGTWTRYSGYVDTVIDVMFFFIFFASLIGIIITQIEEN